MNILPIFISKWIIYQILLISYETLQTFSFVGANVLNMHAVLFGK